MNSKSKFSRVLSIFLVLAFIIGILPFAMGAAYGDDAEEVFENAIGFNTKDSKINAIDIEEGTLEAYRDRDYSGLVFNANFGEAKDSKTAGKFSSEQLTYVEAYAEMLTDPVGLVDLDGSANEMKHVFVWLQDLPTALEDAYQRSGMHNRNYERVREDGRRARNNIRSSHRSQIEYEYSVVFSGFALEATIAELEAIAALDGVFAITEVTYQQMDYVPDPEYKMLGNAGARELMEIADLHADGKDGTGVKVGVIDSGIQTNHPDLAGAFKGGYNFAPRGILNTGGRSPDLSTPDGNHGTHVSGIIASQGVVMSLGVAPGVDLYMAQVFTPDRTNSASTADINAALEAFSGGNPNPGTYPNINLPKMDVVNMSLGSDSNTAYQADFVARNNACLAGVMIVNSAGNNAYPTSNTTDRRNYSLGTGGVSLPISVAASQYGGNPILSYNPTVSNTAGATGKLNFYCENGDSSYSGVFRDGSFGSLETRSVTYGPMAPPDTVYTHPRLTYTIEPLVYIAGKGYELYYACANIVPTAGGTTGSDMTLASMDALNALPAGSLSGKILAVNRGQAFFEYKVQALRLGAAGLIVINRDEAVIGNLNIGSETSAKDLLIFSAPASFKRTLYDLVQGGQTAYLDPGALNKVAHVAEPADFSSIGPVNETAEIKPDIMAPGWSVLSTDLGSSYTEMGGTSMSSPWVAGVAALVKQQFPTADTFEIKARIMNTADPFVIKPLTGRPNGNPNYYFNYAGKEISVFEQGAGFVNPKGAVYTPAYITVMNYDIPKGSADRATYDEARMASLSFGPTNQGDTSKTLTATVNGGTVSSIEVTYNKDTRYSNKNLNDAVEVFYEIAADGKTFDVWLEVSMDACADAKVGGNLYEGYVIATVNGTDMVLPWATRVGETIIVEEFDLLGTAERPIVSSSTNTAIRSAGGTAPLNSNSTTYYFTWDAEWPVSPFYGAAVLELTLVDADTLVPVYIYDPVGPLPSYSNGGLYRVANLISGTRSWNLETNRYEAVANGAYILAAWIDNPDGSVELYGWLDLGVVVSDGLGDMAVKLTIDQADEDGFILVDRDPAVTTVDISGRVFSPALDLAAEAGFLWTEVDDFWGDDMYYLIDQSLNAIGFATTANIYISGTTAYNLFLAGGNPWPCDEDGYFALRFNVPQAAKNGGFPFTLGTNNTIVGVEGLYYNDNGASYPMIGGNKSAAVRPQFKVEVPEVTEVSLDNIAGTLTAAFLMPDDTVPPWLLESGLEAVLTVDGEVEDILFYEGYDDETGIATWTFTPVKFQSFAWFELEATVSYVEFGLESSASDTDISIYLTSIAPSASVDKLNGNQNKLHIWVAEVYSDGSTEQEYWNGMINNNAAANYKVGPYVVYVDTKGNDQIRACDIISGP